MNDLKQQIEDRARAIGFHAVGIASIDPHSTHTAATRLLLSALMWHPVDEEIAERAGQLGREWLPSHSGMDGADLAIAATALMLEADLLTRNVRHFPMFPGLAAPY